MCLCMKFKQFIISAISSLYHDTAVDLLPPDYLPGVSSRPSLAIPGADTDLQLLNQQDSIL